MISSRRALVFSGPRRLDIVDERLDAPAPGHLLVKTVLSAISAGTELMAYRGELPPELSVDETLGSLRGQRFAFPFRYGYAQVGDVVGVGAGLDPSWMGRCVFAFAPHASAFTVPARDVVPVPADIIPEAAALLAHMETAVNLLLDGQPLLGENVTVIGLGTIGLLTAALLSRFPLAVLALVEPHPQRARSGVTLAGGRAALATTEEDLARLLDPRGADLVYELSGNPQGLNLAVGAAALEGRVVIGSWYGAKPERINLGGAFHRRRLRLIGSQVSHIDAALTARWDRARRFETAWHGLRGVDPAIVVSHRFPFQRASEAYQLLDQANEGVQQVLLVHGHS